MTTTALPFDWVRRQAAGAVRQGISFESLLEKSFITPKFGDNRDTISPLQHTLLCTNTTLAVEDATHGLASSGMEVPYTAIGLRMALGCENLEGAILALDRLYARASKAVRIQLKTEQETAILSVHMQAEDEEDSAFLEENYLCWLYIQVLFFLGRAPPILGISLRDPRHFCLGLQHFAIPGFVQYGSVTEIRLPRLYLGEPPAARAGANVVWEAQQPWLALMREGAPIASTGYVKDDRFVRFSEVARDSGKSVSTLRRHLQASDSGFRDARRRALVNLATERLASGAERLDDISADLGYSDVRSFRRFIRSATGLTPQQIRDRRGASVTQDDARALAALEATCARIDF